LRVAVTRPKDRADETANLIKDQGWEPIIVGAVEIVTKPIDPNIKLDDFDWLVVTSATGADILLKHFADGLKRINIAVVGPKTGKVFEKKGIHPKIVSEVHVGEAMAQQLLVTVSGKRVLVARAAAGRKELVEELEKVASVSEIQLYDSLPPSDNSDLRRLKKFLENKELDSIIFTSSLISKNILEFLGDDRNSLLSGLTICAIGPITAATLEEYEIKVDCTPKVHTIEGALDEIKKGLG
jgi:uroporphyrinogen-III synthase